MTSRRIAVLAASGLLAASLAACSADDEVLSGGRQGRPDQPSASTIAPPTGPETEPPATSDPPTATPIDLDAALSDPVEDSKYPDVGDPSVDALHYGLDLTWDPDTDTLTGSEVLTFRAPESADSIQLDFGEPLEIDSLEVDGQTTSYQHEGKDLVISTPVVADSTYELAITYSGTPQPVQAPTTRSDLSTLGFTIDDQHQTWTMQEPFGAYTWYAVNDQPSDKALYDFTLHVPSPWTGIAGGTQLTSDDDGTTTTTAYQLNEPAASYLTTLAFGDYDKTDDVGPNGLPITYWTPRGQSRFDAGLSTAPKAIAYLEKYLGPYPFDTAGILVVDSESGMETQTMITLGNTAYATGPNTVVHEFAHQWYGDRVTPSDWRDVWMNEGMAMYLQLMWEADQAGTDIDDYIRSYRGYEVDARRQAGPPADYKPSEFGSSNIYFGPAFMWNELRKMIGDESFFAIVRGWPESQDNQSTDRDAFLAYVEQQSGRDLDDFWDAWLLGKKSPPLS